MSNEEASLIDFSFSSATTYTFVEEIGRGGMGIVYLAERDNEGVRDQVVMKILAGMLRMNRDERYQSAGEVGVLLEQKYLYATGFGPTNNSLASYIDVFDKGFKGYRQDQLKQLVFLKGDDGKIKLLTRISRDSYSPLGMELAGKRPGTLIHKALLG